MNNVPIFNINIASQLVKKGYIIRDLQPNKMKEGKTVCYFERSKDLLDTLDEEYNIKIRGNINGNESRKNSRSKRAIR